MKTIMQKAVSLLCLLVLLLTLAPAALADAEHGEFAKSSEMAASKEVARYGMTPIAASLLADGS
ncbi:MAG: hypothetical protein MJ075_04165, partial [Oscillospiraceae bacterium]|nr:hypothetical protein [Oscillospiraceae bacterium]